MILCIGAVIGVRGLLNSTHINDEEVYIPIYLCIYSYIYIPIQVIATTEVHAFELSAKNFFRMFQKGPVLQSLRIMIKQSKVEQDVCVYCLFNIYSCI